MHSLYLRTAILSVASSVLCTSALAQNIEDFSLARLGELLSSEEEGQSTTVRIEQCEMRVETAYHVGCDYSKRIKREEAEIDLRSVGEVETNEAYGSYFVNLWPEGPPTQDEVRTDTVLHYCDGSTFRAETESRWVFSTALPVNDDAVAALNEYITTNCRDTGA